MEEVRQYLLRSSQGFKSNQITALSCLLTHCLDLSWIQKIEGKGGVFASHAEDNK